MVEMVSVSYQNNNNRKYDIRHKILALIWSSENVVSVSNENAVVYSYSPRAKNYMRKHHHPNPHLYIHSPFVVSSLLLSSLIVSLGQKRIEFAHLF